MNPSSSDHTLPVTHDEIDAEARLFSPAGQQQRIIRKRHLVISTSLPNEDDEEDDAQLDELMDEDEHEGEDFIHPTTSSSSQLNCNSNNNNNNDDLAANNVADATSSLHSTINSIGNDRPRQDGKGTAVNADQGPLLTPTPSSSSSIVVPTTPRSRNGNPKVGEKLMFLVNLSIFQNTSWLDTQPKLNAKSKSGYILFSAEVRKRVMNENPDAGFGEVSKIVGIEWKRLSDSQKRQYETRAQFIAEERAKADLLTPNSKMPQVLKHF